MTLEFFYQTIREGGPRAQVTNCARTMTVSPLARLLRCMPTGNQNS